MKRLSVAVRRRDGGTDRYTDVTDLHVFGERLLVQLAAEDGDDPVVLYADNTWTSVEVATAEQIEAAARQMAVSMSDDPDDIDAYVEELTTYLRFLGFTVPEEEA